MNRRQAIAECMRWLAYLDAQAAKAKALGEIAADCRAGRCTPEEGRRRQRQLDVGVTVYDGAKLADAVRVLIK